MRERFDLFNSVLPSKGDVKHLPFLICFSPGVISIFDQWKKSLQKKILNSFATGVLKKSPN